MVRPISADDVATAVDCLFALGILGLNRNRGAVIHKVNHAGAEEDIALVSRFGQAFKNGLEPDEGQVS